MKSLATKKVTFKRRLIEGLPRKVRASTAMSYRTPLEHWKSFCEKNRSGYPVDPLYPYTVDPTEFVVAFFKEFVLKRAYKKAISTESEIRTQIGLQTEENDDTQQLSLIQMAENAPSSKNGGKIVEVPIGIEAVNQYKKALMYLHDFQSERRKVEGPSPKETKEVIEIIKKYEHDLVYDQVYGVI
ncbi:hypothetical protein K7432_005624 [Basidiobolus ranarum]|uniref:Uncharacterized protein n=1 Tax=Basidiobolus ranarum TaxID=34480 RepID=A0ABR2W3U9_9FUNG